MLSAVISSVLSYPALQLALQPVHQWYVHPGPLVLGTAPLNSSTRIADRDRTVSRRSEPSSYHFNWRTAKPLGPAPAPGCDEPTSVPNTTVDMSSWAVSACYPRRTFYPLSDGPSTQNHRITMTVFRLCSTCQSHSQASLCHCTLRTISDRSELTFLRLRYYLGATAPVKLPTIQCLDTG